MLEDRVTSPSLWIRLILSSVNGPSAPSRQGEDSGDGCRLQNFQATEVHQTRLLWPGQTPKPIDTVPVARRL